MSRDFVRFVAIVAASLATAACSSSSSGGTSSDGGTTEAGSSQKLPIGSPCTMDSDCGGSGFMCMTDHPGGYCIFMCDITKHDADCPSGSACQSDGTSMECHKECSSMGDCRAGYVCAPASMTPTNTVSHAICDVPAASGDSGADSAAD